jgi:hypothetical protein
MDSFRANFLNSKTAKFSKGSSGVLQLEIKDEIFYPKVWLFRAFPLSGLSGFISVRNADAEDLPEIGLIEDISKFPATMQKLITEELDKRYFVPVITEILSIKEAGDRLDWEVLTDKGNRQFTVRAPYEHIRSLKDNNLLIIDIHNCRYEIRDYNLLSNKIKDILAKYIYI